MSAYLGRLATQLAGRRPAPAPVVLTGSPIAQHDQLPLVEGLESVGPAPLDSLEDPPIGAAAPDGAPARELTARVDDQRGPSTLRPGSPPPARPRAVARPEPSPTPRRDEGPAPTHERTTKTLQIERHHERTHVVSRPRGAPEMPPASPVDSRPPRGPRVEPPRQDPRATRPPPSSAFDLADVLGRISREIADANRPSTARPEVARPLDVGRPPLAATPLASPSEPPGMASTPTPAGLEPLPSRQLPMRIPPPTVPDLARAPTPSGLPAVNAPAVTIAELHVEVIREAPRRPTRPAAPPAAAPARPSIGPRPSKRRFAQGRS